MPRRYMRSGLLVRGKPHRPFYVPNSRWMTWLPNLRGHAEKNERLSSVFHSKRVLFTATTLTRKVAHAVSLSHCHRSSLFTDWNTMKFVGLVGIVIGEWRFLFSMLYCFVYFFTQKLVTVCSVEDWRAWPCGCLSAAVDLYSCSAVVESWQNAGTDNVQWLLGLTVRISAKGVAILAVGR